MLEAVSYISALKFSMNMLKCVLELCIPTSTPFPGYSLVFARVCVHSHTTACACLQKPLDSESLGDVIMLCHSDV